MGRETSAAGAFFLWEGAMEEKKRQEMSLREWCKAREDQLLKLRKNPKLWAFVERLIKTGTDAENWETNPVRPILESYRKIQNLMEDDLEERIFEAASKFVPSE